MSDESTTLDYAIKLQRLIENLKSERPPPYPELHHHKMIVAAKARIAQLSAQVASLEAALREAMRWDWLYADNEVPVPQHVVDQCRAALGSSKETKQKLEYTGKYADGTSRLEPKIEGKP